jgi:cellulose synthase/poly-beta-1,6-N-acetylglucosamine synthase-like glycosyltransferase
VLARYLAHPDPLATAGNLVALVVGSNQPLYPLTLYWATGADVSGTFICFLSAPVFLAVPFVARRSSLGGRVMLVVLGAVDTFISIKSYGAAGGTELYLGPCILLSTMLFRWRERWLAFGLTAAILAGLFILHGRYGASYLAWSDRDYATMVDLNIVYVAILAAFIGLSVGRARGDG